MKAKTYLEKRAEDSIARNQAEKKLDGTWLQELEEAAMEMTTFVDMNAEFEDVLYEEDEPDDATIAELARMGIRVTRGAA